MSYPNLTAVENAAPPATLSSHVPGFAQVGQQFALNAALWSEVDANGNPNGVPLGQSGPFVVKIDAEEILCAAFEAGIVTVFDNAGTSGRAFSGSTAAHHRGSSVTLISTSVQSVATGGGGGGGVSLELNYNGVGTFTTPVLSLPDDWTGEGNGTFLATLTTGEGQITGLLDSNGNPIPDGWTFPALIFVEDSTIFDITALSAFVLGTPGGGGITLWGPSGGMPTLSLQPYAIIFPELPTSDPGIAGQLYSLAGAVMVSAG
jgi:hypothetical protein